MADNTARPDSSEMLSKIQASVDAVHRRLDDDDARRARHDDAGRFSHRRHDDDDAKYHARHDAEEKELAESLEKGGVPKEKAADRAKKARKDAERCDDAARTHFTARHDDDDDSKHRGRRDAEEKSLAERFEKEGEAREDAHRFAHDSRRRRDDDDDAAKRRHDAEEAEKKKLEDDKKRADAGAHHMHDDDARKKADDAQKRADAVALENKTLKEQIDALNARMTALTREIPQSERDALARIQARADQVLVMFGDRAVPPITGESALAYRMRMANRLKQHSPRFKDEKIDGLGDAALAAAEDIIYADAQNTARTTSGAKAGILVPEITYDDAGRKITRYHGDPLAWMLPFMGGDIPRCSLVTNRRA